MPQHYIMSPLETASNLFRNTLGMNLHRLLYTAKEADAALIVPVFLPGTRQRANFHGYANDYLSSVQSAFKGREDTIMRNRTPGWMQMLTYSHRYVVPIQAYRYEGRQQFVLPSQV